MLHGLTYRPRPTERSLKYYGRQLGESVKYLVPALLLITLSCAIDGGGSMTFEISGRGPQIVSFAGLDVEGFSIRTNNDEEMAGQGRIGAVWQRFLYQRSRSGRPNPDKSMFYAIYTNYDSDETGDYDFFLGCAIDSSGAIESDMQRRSIPTGERIPERLRDAHPDAVLPGCVCGRCACHAHPRSHGVGYRSSTSRSFAPNLGHTQSEDLDELHGTMEKLASKVHTPAQTAVAALVN